MRVETGESGSDQTGSGALFVGGLAAILASTCCLGPLVLVALGVSGAWIGNLTRLEPYRRVFYRLVLSWLCSLQDDGFFGQHRLAGQAKCAQCHGLAAFIKSYLE